MTWLALTRGVLRCIVVEGTFGDDLEGRKGPGGIIPQDPHRDLGPGHESLAEHLAVGGGGLPARAAGHPPSRTIDSPIVDPPRRGLTTSGKPSSAAAPAMAGSISPGSAAAAGTVRQGGVAIPSAAKRRLAATLSKQSAVASRSLPV